MSLEALTSQDLRRLPVQQILTVLLNDKALIYKRYEKGASVLHRAVIDGRVELVDALAREFHELLHLQDVYGGTPLHCLGETVWLAAGKDGKMALAMAKILVDRGSLLDVHNNRGETPALCLWMRSNCAEGWMQLLRFLVESGSDPNAQDREGWTFLHRLAEFADSHGPTPQLDLLLTLGASPDIKNNRGETPAEVARTALNRCHCEDLVNKFVARLQSQSLG